MVLIRTLLGRPREVPVPRMTSIRALILAICLAAPAALAVSPKSVTVLPSSDGRVYSEFPAGDRPAESSPIAWSGLSGGVTNAGINAQVEGTPFSFNVCPYLTGDEDTTATLSVVTVSGDNATTEGWALSAATCATGTSNLTHDGSQDGAGRMKLRADGTGANDDDSAEFDWSFAATDPGDDGYQFPQSALGTSAESLDVVETFHNISLYWDQAGNNTTDQALCRFREKGTSTWYETMPLWYDARTIQTTSDGDSIKLEVPYGYQQFRGSILKVEPETIYQIECQTESTRLRASAEATTWDETPPEAAPTEPAASSTAQLNITTGGSASAYKVYRRTGGWTIDRNNAGDGPGGSEQHCIYVNAPYVIIDGVTCQDFQDGGVFFGPLAHDVWVINSEFTDFGIDDPNTVWGCNGSSAFLTEGDHEGGNEGIVRIVIQNNYIHTPKYDANSWDENGNGVPSQSADNRPVSTNCFLPGSSHPAGSSASDVHDTGGNWVWRYNTFGNRSADFLKMFDDGTSGGQNFSYAGDCPRDCDYYQNFFTHIWDDGHQNEGAGMNNREYENYVEYSRTCSGRAPIAIGPSYIFRNICTKGLMGPNASNPALTPPGNNGWFFKCATKPDDGLGLNDVEIGQGYTLIAHNTVYKTSGQSDGRAQSMQLDDGCGRNLYVYCNIFDTSSSMGSVNRGYWTTAEADGKSDIEDNLWGNGQTKPSADGSGTTNVSPSYDTTGNTQYTSDVYEPAAASAQIDTCDISLPNLQYGYAGSKPDRGAVERGQSRVTYGVR